MKNKIIKILFIILSILIVMPSIIYMAQNKTVMGFDTYYNFFINKESNKALSTIIYLILFVALMALYVTLIRKKEQFKDIKQILKYVAIISIIFVIMLPWTSSDIFYYMGVGELDSQYGQNPYYVTMKEYYGKTQKSMDTEQNINNEKEVDDDILKQGANGYWSNTTVVYGPIAQLIFKICTAISFKNIDVCLLIFKILNVIVHLANCYLIYKLSNKKFALIYGVNPFALLEFLGNVHNDIIVVFFVLLTLCFMRKHKLLPSLVSLALATGIKYFTILLLPVVIIYHFRDESKLSIRFLRCFQYGILFLIIFALEYTLYFRDFQVIFAMFAQTSKYSKSLYSVLTQKNESVMIVVKNVLRIVFIGHYLKFCIDLITSKNIRLYKALRKYNTSLILFLLILTSFQQWYLVWLFATMMWQKTKTIRNIIALTATTEIATSIYMFKSEWFIYDIYFVGIIICLFMMWQIYEGDKEKSRVQKIFR